MANNLDIKTLTDDQKLKLVDARWASSYEIWDKIDKIYKHNTSIYENKSEWLQKIPERRRLYQVQANRVFVNMEAVINSLIANPPGINILPAKKGLDSQEFARRLESYFRKKYNDLNVKETLRMGLRNLYFGRLIVIKPFWNPTINDFDFRSVDPRNVRVSKYARKEVDSEFCIEEISDNLCAIIDRFPTKKQELMKKYGLTDEVQLYTQNPEVKYKEAWINDYVIFKLDDIILGTIKNPYWDWEGIQISDDEEKQLTTLTGDARRQLFQHIKLDQPKRTSSGDDTTDTVIQNAPTPSTPPGTPQQEQSTPTPQGDPSQPQSQPDQAPVAPQAQPAPATPQNEPVSYKTYYFNYFESPRKPYIIATIFNNENSPIGRTDMITLSADLQRGIDKRKMDIDENSELANGVLKVDASVMGKSDAQRIRFETKGIIWGKGVKDGVTRETGQSLPQMVFDDMKDSRSEIDNIMAATSAFRGEREGQETKAGRLALVQQSYLRLNELVQVVDFVSKETFDWGMQLSKTRYTEYHSTKVIDQKGKQDIIELIQDDFEPGTEVTIIAGKTLPVDNEFKYEQAQGDVKSGYISPVDYLEIAGYENAKELSKNAFLYKVAPFSQFDISDEERQKIPPPIPQSRLTERVDYNDLPPAAKAQWLARQGITVTEQQITQEGESSPVAIAFKDLPPDGQIQAAAKLGITLDPTITYGEKIKAHMDNAAIPSDNPETP